MMAEFLCAARNHVSQTLAVKFVHDEPLTGFYAYVEPCPICCKKEG